MCGKFKQQLDLSALAALLRLPVNADGWPAHAADVSAGKIAAAVTGSADQSHVQRMRFGFASAPGLGVRPVINARAETAASKPMFRAAFSNQRCLIPAVAFYEQGRMFASPSAFCLGGLWQQGADGMAECVVITQAASGMIAAFHDRMPLVLADTTACRDWLLRAQMPSLPADLEAIETQQDTRNQQMALF